MEAPALDEGSFRASFPEYADAAKYPQAMLARHFAMACTHITPGAIRLHSVMPVLLGLMTAHLVRLETALVSGDMSGIVASASVDKVNVSLTPPPVKTQLAWWLNLTPYGAQLLTLLQKKTAGGIYVGGRPFERDAFRKAGGVFVKQGAASG